MTKPRPSGSTMSTRQLAWALVKGRSVTAHVPTGDIVGFFAGMDDYHWLLVRPNLTTTLVHKSTPVTIGSYNALEAESKRDQIDEIIDPFLHMLVDQAILPPHVLKQKESSS